MAPRRTRTPARLVVLIVTLLAAIVGCAGAGDDESSGDAPTTEAAAGEPGPTPEEEVAAMTDDELATEAYVAGYPLVVSMRTLQQLGGLVGVNSLFWQGALSGPESRVIVAPNRDTLYSIAILDLRSEPMVLTLPEVPDRYHTYQLLSPWTESFAYIGTRATGGRAGTWVIAPPGWDGEAPDGAEVIESPTPMVFLLGRWLVDDEADVDAVTAISRDSSLVGLSEALGTPAPAAPPALGAAPGTAQDVPADAAFFAELAEWVAVNPAPTARQRALFDRAGTELALDGGPGGPDAELLDAAAAAGAARIDDAVGARAEVVDGWSVNRAIGTYDDDVDTRAVVARIGWGANVPEEAVYPVARVDVDGAPLDGADGRTYRMTFPAGALPPLDDPGFWSLSVYGVDMFFVDNPAGRYTVGDRTPDLVTAADGSVTIVLAHEDPGDPDANWLPVPDGPFVLMLRLYLPGADIIDGTWNPPPVMAD